jgi:hypothetical protein
VSGQDRCPDNLGSGATITWIISKMLL